MSDHDRKTETPGTVQNAEETVTAPSAEAPEEDWDATLAEQLVEAIVVPFRTVQHPTVAAQMERLRFHRMIGAARTRRDLPGLRNALAEFEAWMRIESVAAEEFWIQERVRQTARERAHVRSDAETPASGISGGHDLYPVDPTPK